MLAFESADFSHSRADEAAFDWCPLRDVGKIVTGATPSTSESENYGGTIPFIKPTDLNAGYVVCESQHTLSDVGATKARMLPPMSVLVTCIGATIGKTGLARVACATNQQINAISLSPFVLSEFAYWYLESPVAQEWIKSNASATTLPILNKSRFGELPFPVTEISHQARVVASIETQLSRLEAGVSALKRAQANLKRYRAAVLQAALNERSLAIPARPLSSLIEGLGQGWSPKCDLTREPEPQEWAVITTTAVQPMQYVDNQGKPLPSSLKPREHLEIKEGDFLMTRKGPRWRTGVTCLVRRTRPRLMLCDTVYRFRCREDEVIPRYLEIVLNTPKTTHLINGLKAGINESGVSLTHDKIGTVPIPLPPLADQERIVAEVERRLSVVDELEATLAANLRRAARLRQSVLSAAFAGPRGARA